MTPIKETGSTPEKDVQRKPLASGTGAGPSTATEALAMEREAAQARPLPKFLQEQVRYNEAYLTLIMELNAFLGDGNWQETPMVEVKEKFNRIIARSMKIYI